MENNKFDELLKKLNELKLIQDNSSWEEVIPLDIWNEYSEGDKIKYVGTLGIDYTFFDEIIYKTDVFEFENRFFGIKYVLAMYGETYFENFDNKTRIEFFEMEEFTTVSYRNKK